MTRWAPPSARRPPSAARSPLALSVASARVAAWPGFPLAALAAELRAAPGRLDALDVGDPQASVQAVFSWSSQQLSPDAARMFRLMGLHPGPDISVSAAAGLAGADEPQAPRLLRELTRDCLIAEHLPGRYAFHDLLRTYAANQARAIDREPERAAAIGRILDYYAHIARAAAILLYPSKEMIAFAPHMPVIGTELPADDQHGVAWFEAERANLTAGVALAAESGFDSHAWQLPWFMAAHFARRGYWNERVALQRTALTAATRLEDSAGQAVSSCLLANAHMDLGDHDQALRYYRASAGLYQRLGNRLGEAKACQGIATVAGRQGRYADALPYFDYALQLHQAIGHKLGEAEILINMGFCYGGLGDYEEGHELCGRSLALAAELGNRYVEALAWHGLGYSELIRGDFTEADASFQQALTSARKAGDRFHQADALTHLGDIRHAAGQELQAREAWSGALAIFEEI